MNFDLRFTLWHSGLLIVALALAWVIIFLFLGENSVTNFAIKISLINYSFSLLTLISCQFLAKIKTNYIGVSFLIMATLKVIVLILQSADTFGSLKGIDLTAKCMLMAFYFVAAGVDVIFINKLLRNVNS